MSTDYEIFRHTVDGKEQVVELYEHSAKLDLYIEETIGGVTTTQKVDDMTPAQVVRVGLEMLKVASYQIDDDDFCEAVAAAVFSESLRHAGMIGMLESAFKRIKAAPAVRGI